MLFVSLLINILPFVIVSVGVILQHLSIWYLFVFLTLPMAITLFYLLVQFHKDPFKTFSPKFWMGPMEKWEEKKQHKLEWFLIRWMLARNLTSFFAFIISIVSICIGIFR
jgi:1,4-dihydroxy-2-naphthoate octaprenyltransferase